MDGTDERIRQLAKILSTSKVILDASVEKDFEKLVGDVDVALIASKIVESYSDGTVVVLNSEKISKVIETLSTEKIPPVQIEVEVKSDFNPIAKEYDAEYKVRNMWNQNCTGNIDDFLYYFRSRLNKIRGIIQSGRSGVYGFVTNLEVIKKYANGREVTVVGMVSDRNISAKGNTIITIEDETGEARLILSSKPGSNGKSVADTAKSIVSDEVIAVKGKIFNNYVMVSEVLFPDIPIRDHNSTEEDIGIAFLSDIHYGSKLFMEKNFVKMIEWLKGGDSVAGNKRLNDIAGKIKYIVIAGDAADGIGVYPRQEKDLAITDVYMQYRGLLKLLESVPDYIHVFLTPGNHDAVQREEPQPPLGKEIIKEFSKDNIHFVSSPVMLNLSGIKVLSYHGTSLDSIIRFVPGLNYSAPENAMIELLKRRHLSPIYGGNVIVPSRTDEMVIEETPDVLHMGHIHKNGIASYRGISIINSGTWQASTDFQTSLGHMPTPCMMPVMETKEGKISTINFSGNRE